MVLSTLRPLSVPELPSKNTELGRKIEEVRQEIIRGEATIEAVSLGLRYLIGAEILVKNPQFATGTGLEPGTLKQDALTLLFNKAADYSVESAVARADERMADAREDLQMAARILATVEMFGTQHFHGLKLKGLGPLARLYEAEAAIAAAEVDDNPDQAQLIKLNTQLSLRYRCLKKSIKGGLICQWLKRNEDQHLQYWSTWARLNQNFHKSLAQDGMNAFAEASAPKHVIRRGVAGMRESARRFENIAESALVCVSKYKNSAGVHVPICEPLQLPVFPSPININAFLDFIRPV